MSRKKGDLAESKACDFLIKNGFRIIERNFYSKFGEIDIIALKDEVLHFVEVKSGKSFEPIYAITPEKLKKVIKTANFYLLKKELNFNIQIDALIVKNDQIDFVENITLIS